MSCSEVQMRSTDESLKTYDTFLTEIRKHLNFCFAQFTLQISSVSTEQYRVGVVS